MGEVRSNQGPVNSSRRLLDSLMNLEISSRCQVLVHWKQSHKSNPYIFTHLYLVVFHSVLSSSFPLTLPLLHSASLSYPPYHLTLLACQEPLLSILTSMKCSVRLKCFTVCHTLSMTAPSTPSLAWDPQIMPRSLPSSLGLSQAPFSTFYWLSRTPCPGGSRGRTTSHQVPTPSSCPSNWLLPWSGRWKKDSDSRSFIHTLDCTVRDSPVVPLTCHLKVMVGVPRWCLVCQGLSHLQ